MRPEREKWSEKIRAGGLRVEGGRFELSPGEDCFLILYLAAAVSCARFRCRKSRSLPKR